MFSKQKLNKNKIRFTLVKFKYVTTVENLLNKKKLSYLNDNNKINAKYVYRYVYVYGNDTSMYPMIERTR